MYPYLIESLHYAKANRLETHITTNALKLPQLAEQICDAGLKKIYFSLDGTEGTHNEIRGHKLSFQRPIEGIEKLVIRKDAPRISVFYIITQLNFQLKYWLNLQYCRENTRVLFVRTIR